MAVHRGFHTVWYLLYLVTFLIFLWFFLHYSGVASWVFWLFFAGIIIIGIGVIQKETLMRKKVKPNGEEYCYRTRYNWTIAYSIFHILALGLIITGLVFTIIQSSVPWWVWLILFISFVLSIVGTMIHTYNPRGKLWASIVHFLALGLGLTAFVFIIVTSGAPYWVWLIYALSILFAVLAGSFEHVSSKNQITVKDKCEKDCADYFPREYKEGECEEECREDCHEESSCEIPCKMEQPCKMAKVATTSSQMVITSSNPEMLVSTGKQINVANLPTVEISEQSL